MYTVSRLIHMFVFRLEAWQRLVSLSIIDWINQTKQKLKKVVDYHDRFDIRVKQSAYLRFRYHNKYPAQSRW
jgi:hypothetical protein